jgi:hypothetical protein
MVAIDKVNAKIQVAKVNFFRQSQTVMKSQCGKPLQLNCCMDYEQIIFQLNTRIFLFTKLLRSL